MCAMHGHLLLEVSPLSELVLVEGNPGAEHLQMGGSVGG